MSVSLTSGPTWHIAHFAVSSGATVLSNIWRAVPEGGMSSPGIVVSIPPTQAPSIAIATVTSSWLRMMLWVLAGTRWGLAGTAAADEDHGEAEQHQGAGAGAARRRAATERGPRIGARAARRIGRRRVIRV